MKATTVMTRTMRTDSFLPTANAGDGASASVVSGSQQSDSRKEPPQHYHYDDLRTRDDFELIDLTVEHQLNMAFEILVERYRGSIYALAYRMLRNHDDAADVSQEVFFKAYEALSSFKKKSSFHTWLYRIATNSCINYLRKYTVQHHVELNTHHAVMQADTLDTLYKIELQDVVNEAIEQLPEKQKATVILRVCEGLSHREVSRLLKCSVGTAKANYFHAIRNLRHFMRHYIAANHDEETSTSLFPMPSTAHYSPM